ncbi:MAG: hypothetical protein FWG26_08230 [Betaproteobacteria bacterium]|nr:hypothetical protein [Betaproteobacteria bacterium]
MNRVKLVTALATVVVAALGRVPAFAETFPAEDVRKSSGDLFSIPNAIVELKLSRDTAGPEIKKCLPKMSQDIITRALDGFPKPRERTVTLSSEDGFFAIIEKSGYCIQKSTSGYPMLAPEAFYETVNPNNVPSKLKEQWYKRIATLIAQKGVARIAYVDVKGGAYIVDYSINKDDPIFLFYPFVFKKHGEWESEKLDAKFSDNRLNSIRATEYNEKHEKPYLHIKTFRK